jgi:hypothetical protein
MIRRDETALVRAWIAWRTDRAVDDQVYLEFYDSVVRDHPRFARIHVFEVVDALVNAVEPDRRESA